MLFNYNCIVYHFSLLELLNYKVIHCTNTLFVEILQGNLYYFLLFSLKHQLHTVITTSDKKGKKELPQLQEGMRTVDRNGQELIKLEYAEKEVEEIGNAFEQLGLHSLIIKDEAATPEKFIKETKNYKYILVSGHGFYDDKKPELFGNRFFLHLHKRKKQIKKSKMILN